MPSDTAPSTHTHFFRDEAQLDAVVDALGSRDDGTRVPRLWSAGCSTGAEPYSIAMLCAERSVRVGIHASDFRADALAVARAARYDAHALRHASAERIARHFDPRDGGFVVRGSIRDQVRFALQDLCEVASTPGAVLATYDVIVCRNVLIYYDRVDAARLVTALASRLAPGGLLFLGASDHFTFREADVPVERIDVRGTCAYAFRPERIADDSFAPRRSSTPPPSESIRQDHHVLDAMNEAFACIARHSFEEAERLLRAAIDEHPHAPEPRYYLGLLHRKQGRLRDAVDALRSAHLLAADFWPASFLLAGVWDRLGRADRAEQIRRHLVALLERGADLSRFDVARADPLFDPAEVLAACRG